MSTHEAIGGSPLATTSPIIFAEEVDRDPVVRRALAEWSLREAVAQSMHELGEEPTLRAIADELMTLGVEL